MSPGPRVLAPVLTVTDAAAELTAANDAVRTPLALSRRVGVVAVEGGSGTSTVAAALGSLLARRRRGTVLATDAGGGGLRERLGLPAGPGWPDAAASVRADARSAAQAQAGLEETAAGLRLLDLTRRDESWPAPAAAWLGAVGPVARFYDLVVTDWGTRPWAADLPEAAALSHVVVLVARADRRSALEAAGGLLLLREATGGPAGVLVLVDADRSSDRPEARLGHQLGVPVLRIGFDRSLADGPGLDSRALRARTRLALIRLGQVVVNQAVATSRPQPTP